jgi:NAD-specific glutamate dehydrogenase
MIIMDEPEVGNLIKDNFLTYSNVLTTGKYPIEKYLNAIKFVSYKLMNMTNRDAYIHTYPDRYKKLKERYVDVEGLTEEEFEKKVSSYVYSVAKSNLVVSILSQVQIPTKLLNMGLLQEAINTEASLMRNARSEIVREKAANTLIQYLGQEEDNRIQADVGYKKDDIIEQYELAMKNMVEEQLSQIRKGADVKQIANAPIVEAEVIE